MMSISYHTNFLSQKPKNSSLKRKEIKKINTY